MHDAARQIVVALMRLERDLVGEHRAVRVVEERQQLGHRRGPPGGSAEIVEVPLVAAAGEMEVREDFSDTRAVGRGR